MFYLGSYSANSRGGTLQTEPQVAGLAPAVHRRRNGSEPHLLGTLAYLVFARGLPSLLGPVRVEADLTLSLLRPSAPCGPHCPISAPREQYGPRRWLVTPDPSTHQNSHGSSQPSQVIRPIHLRRSDGAPCPDSHGLAADCSTRRRLSRVGLRVAARRTDVGARRIGCVAACHGALWAAPNTEVQGELLWITCSKCGLLECAMVLIELRGRK